MPTEYPPPHHMVRDLRIAIERSPGMNTAILPVVPEILSDQGSVRAGVLATMVDMLCGGLALETAHPTWLATLDLSLHLLAPLTQGNVFARGTVLRAGRQTVVLEVALADDAGTPAGLATMTFALLERRADTPVFSGDLAPRSELGLPGSGLTAPFVDLLGIRVLDAAAGVAEVEIHPYIENSLSALQGGAAATLVDVVSVALGRELLGAKVDTTDLEIRYLALGKLGPIRAQARVLRREARSAALRVEVRESGPDARLCYVATTRVG
ncbi:MAG: PaaI family thioesterase [Solirubrobacteraceae bacterium]